MGVMVDAVDWVTADRFCELTGEQVTNLKNLRPQWDEGLVWVKVSDRRIMYSIKGYNAWVEQAALAFQKAQEHEVEKSRLTLNGTAKEHGLRSTLLTPRPTSARRLRLEKTL